MIQDSKYEDLIGWKDFHHEDLWILDKLILSTRLGYACGPRGMPVPKSGTYIIRPIMNLMGMGYGAQFVNIEKETDQLVPDGFFWCEKFKGRHLSIDYEDKEQILCLEGIRRKKDPVWKWKEWRKTKDDIPMPDILKNLKGDYRHFNIEMIGDKIIEVHIRLNPNWRHGDYESAIPVFKEEKIRPPKGYTYIEDENALRKGFYFK
jgi:hypothetical protein